MRSFFCLIPLLFSVACAVDSAAPCGDAAYWSGRSADWPLDEVWVGGEPLALSEAMDLLELPPADARDALTAALVVAELNLAAGGSDDVLPHVYAGHAWLSLDDGDPALEHEAAELARALESSSCR
ncbi:MAG: hypothetical protein H6737_18500 [Alphaproteobacteria bacterium]|nr:hypothetical protein [Alphaproteobacteria bacterium]